MGGEEDGEAAVGGGVGAPIASDIRRRFGQRLRRIRQDLGYSQEQMAHALGIQPARYSKYEIGRSEAPFEVLVRIARLAEVDLHYLITGEESGRGESGKWLNDELGELLHVLPVPAVVFDRQGRLVRYNTLYQQQFFADQPQLLKRGTPQEVMVRNWGYRQGLSDLEVKDFARVRMRNKPPGRSTTELQVGRWRLRIAETIDNKRRLVLLTGADTLSIQE